MNRSLVSVLTRLVVAVAVLTPGLSAAPPPAVAAIGPCGEGQSLPGPGRYVGGFQGLLTSKFAEVDSAAEFALPIAGALEFEINDSGWMAGNAKLSVADLPEVRALPVTAAFDLTTPIEGQLTEPIEQADIPVRAQVNASVTGARGNRLIGWSGSLNLHLREFRRGSCAALQGAWELEGSNSPEAEEFAIQDAQWVATLIGFDEGLDQRIRSSVEQIAARPPMEALGLSPALSTADADALIDALAGGAAAPPSGGLFGLYEQVRNSPGPAAQIRCLADLVRTAIAAELEEHLATLATGADPTYEETIRLGYGLRLGQIINSGAECPAYAMGLGALRVMIQVSMNEAMAGGELDRVARLTRAARLHDLQVVAKRGADWLQERGYPL